MEDRIKSMEDVRSLIREMDVPERKGLLIALYESDLILKERFRAMMGIDEEEYRIQVDFVENWDYYEIMDTAIRTRVDSLPVEEIRMVATNMEHGR